MKHASGRGLAAPSGLRSLRVAPCALAPSPPGAAAPPARRRFRSTSSTHKLPNGLKVVLSRDTTAPRTVVAVYYNIGFRIEPKDRTGFAHLFEHMMFQGSENLGKMEFIKLVQSQRRGPERLDALRLHQLLRGRPLAHARDGALGRGRPDEGPRDHRRQPQEPAGGRQERGPGQRAQPALRRLPVARPAAVRQRELVQRAQLLRRPEGPRRRDARGRRRSSSRPTTRPTTRCWSSSATSTRRRRRPGSRSTSRPVAASQLPAKPDISEPRQEKEKRATKDDALATRPALAIGVPRAPAQHAGVLRDGPDRRDPRPGQGQPPLPGARPEERAHRRRQRRDQLGPRQHVQRQRPDALGRLALPRQGQVRRRRSSRSSTTRSRSCARRRWTRRRSTARS